MALVKCPKCALELDSQSAECPQCGLKIKQYFANIERLRKKNEEKARAHQARLREERQQKEENSDRIRREQLKKLTPCAACKNTISTRALACPRCGEPREHAENRPITQEDEGFAHLTDIHFRTFLTPQLVKIFYILTVIVGCLGTTLTIVGSFWTKKYGVVIPSIITLVLLVLFTRIICESALILFKIEENTRK